MLFKEMVNENVMTSNEKMINKHLGENDSKTFYIGEESGRDIIKDEIINKFNDEVAKEEARQTQYFSDLDEYAKKVNENMKTIEIMPIGNYILVKPFATNPFQKIEKTESGFILSTGISPEFNNTDSGELQEEEQFVLTGVVQEVGPDCKYVRPTDVVMYANHRAVPVPFYRQGLVTFSETAVIAVVNEGLSERFKK